MLLYGVIPTGIILTAMVLVTTVALLKLRAAKRKLCQETDE